MLLQEINQHLTSENQRIQEFMVRWRTDQRTLHVSYFVEVDQDAGDGVQETRQLVHVIIITI